MNDYDGNGFGPDQDNNDKDENETFASDRAEMNEKNHSGDDKGRNEGSSGYGGYGYDQNSNPYGGNIQYQWNYDDYQKALDNDRKVRSSEKKTRKTKRGMKAFIISLSSVVAVGIISLAGVGIAALVRNNGIAGNTAGSGTSSASAVNPNGPTLKTNNKPSSASSSSTATATPLQMSASQVYNSLKNSIVTIQVYDMQSVDPTAEGSGIIESSNGYIITNEHVIDGAKNIEVVLANQKQYTATLVGKDMKTDLAVLKINATGLKAATFGNSSQLSVAEQVLAIGNPGGLEFSGSVTEGIVSALNRSVTTESGYSENCIQTDAPINPGNSGGALVNMYGQVVGITSSKIEETGYEGMGFAIPINTAKPIIDDIVKYGYVTGRVKLGISVRQFTSYQASIYGYPAGLIVESISSGSDAANKLQEEDIITKIDGISVTDYDQFYAQESKHKAGESVKLTVFRHTTGATLVVSVKLQEDKGDTSISSSSSQSNNDNSQGSYGFGQNGQNSYGYGQNYSSDDSGSSDAQNG